MRKCGSWFQLKNAITASCAIFGSYHSKACLAHRGALGRATASCSPLSAPSSSATLHFVRIISNGGSPYCQAAFYDSREGPVMCRFLGRLRHETVLALP